MILQIVNQCLVEQCVLFFRHILRLPHPDGFVLVEFLRPLRSPDLAVTVSSVTAVSVISMTIPVVFAPIPINQLRYKCRTPSGPTSLATVWTDVVTMTLFQNRRFEATRVHWDDRVVTHE